MQHRLTCQARGYEHALSGRPEGDTRIAGPRGTIEEPFINYNTARNPNDYYVYSLLLCVCTCIILRLVGNNKREGASTSISPVNGCVHRFANITVPTLLLQGQNIACLDYVRNTYAATKSDPRPHRLQQYLVHI